MKMKIFFKLSNINHILVIVNLLIVHSIYAQQQHKNIYRLRNDTSSNLAVIGIMNGMECNYESAYEHLFGIGASVIDVQDATIQHLD